MNLVVFEDQIITVDDLKQGIQAAAGRFELTRKGLKPVAIEPIQIVSRATLEAAIIQANECGGEARIVFVDLDLTQNGLSQEDALLLHDATLPPPLRLRGTEDAGKAGGYLLAWHVLNSKHPKQLLVIASNQASPGSIEDRIFEMRLKARSTVPFEMLKGSLVNEKRRESQICQAIGMWLACHGSPIARIHPDGSRAWFTLSHLIEHTWEARLGSSDDYVAEIVRYLAYSLQLPESEVTTNYRALEIADKGRLHEFLKSLVGSCAACHMGAGRRLEWRHLPFLAIASAPAPGRWMFADGILGQNTDSILPMNTSAFDRSLLELLVGNGDGSIKGTLPQLLCKKEDESVSTLVGCVAAIGLCKITSGACTPALVANFDACLQQKAKLNRDSSSSLFTLHAMLGQFGGSVNVCSSDTSFTIKV